MIITNKNNSLLFKEKKNTSIKALDDLFYIGVKTLIKNQQNQILVLKAEKNFAEYWDLPGGRMKQGESIESTARREIIEETGIAIVNNFVYLRMVLTSIRLPFDNKRTVGLMFAICMAYVGQEIVTLSSEHHTFEWVSPAKAAELLAPVYGTSMYDLVVVSNSL